LPKQSENYTKETCVISLAYGVKWGQFYGGFPPSFSTLFAHGFLPPDSIYIMFGLFKKNISSDHAAADHTNLPLDNFMTTLMAQELPFLDSASRIRVYEILNTYDGPTITSQEELPMEIRELMDL
jgi:hypothetical protein